MTAPIYSAMEQPSEWVYYFLTTQRKNVVKGENVPNFKINTGASSKYLPDPERSMTETVRRTVPFQYHTK